MEFGKCHWICAGLSGTELLLPTLIVFSHNLNIALGLRFAILSYLALQAE
jgi:hypothetical protein